MNDSDPVLMVHTTCADRAEAERLAAGLVEARLAACASIGGEATSIYPWQGRIERDTEVTLTLKTLRSAFDALLEKLRADHSYDVPEVLGVPVAAADADYERWLRDWIDGGDAG